MQAAAVLASMGRRGHAFDNALAESFFAPLETEPLHRPSFRSRDEARQAVFSYIEGFSNARRRHRHSPTEAPTAGFAFRWRDYFVGSAVFD